MNAVDSADFSQTISAGEQADDIFAVTDALEKYITESLANADEVQDIIANLRVESAHPQSNKQSLRALLGGAIMAVPVAAGTDIWNAGIRIGRHGCAIACLIPAAKFSDPARPLTGVEGDSGYPLERGRT